ncbi:hypothetical protein G4313_11465 [Coprococcus eutactus]|jgi:hypothetical protein|nr:hypothetical protein [Coprococcus eutactus]RHV78166.1 hypothetical protein DXB01_10000 [Clostridium sp. OF10-22XD]DAJ88029.1 MAG TPA: Protein of unknown function (DUF1570) [Caudoviricetes sp.]
MKTVNILGTEYKIIFDVPDEEMPEDADGCMDQSIQTIKIAEFESDRNTIQDMDSYRKKVLRHEIVHAFLYESGMWNNSGSTNCWGMDETITDWIAIQSPKLFQAFKEADCL